MGKKAVIISSMDLALKIVNDVDAYLVPLDRFSINYPNTFNIDDIKKLIGLKKEVFVFINKNIHNSEIDELKQILIKVDRLGVNGIIFYDISLVKLKKEMNLKTELVWNQEHLVTNYGTVNYWHSKGVNYAYLSSELTKREIDEIRENTDVGIFVNVFGYIPIFTSRRHLVNNYLDTFNIDKSGNRIYKEGKFYHVVDADNGTYVYCDYVLNTFDVEADYLVYNSNFIDNFDKVIYNDLKKEDGFLYKETIYKVK